MGKRENGEERNKRKSGKGYGRNDRRWERGVKRSKLGKRGVERGGGVEKNETWVWKGAKGEEEEYKSRKQEKGGGLVSSRRKFGAL